MHRLYVFRINCDLGFQERMEMSIKIHMLVPEQKSIDYLRADDGYSYRTGQQFQQLERSTCHSIVVFQRW